MYTHHMRRIGWVIGGVGAGLCGFVIVIAVLWFHYLKESAFYRACLEFSRHHPQLAELIGPIESTAYWPLGFYEESTEEQSGTGHVAFTLRGTKSGGYLVLSAYRHYGHWVVDGATLHRKDAVTRLDTVGELIQSVDGLTLAELAARTQHAMAIQPSLPEPHYLLGDRYLDKKEYERAEAALRLAIASDPTFAPAVNDLGVALMGQERYREALEALEEATQLDPEDAYPYVNQAMIRLEANEFRDLAQARVLLDQARARADNLPVLHDVWADLHQAEGDMEAADAERERARVLREKGK